MNYWRGEMEMKTYMTTNCVVCFELATVWTGYVLDAFGQKISAGWCKQHSSETGFSGHYEKEMGREEEEP